MAKLKIETDDYGRGSRVLLDGDERDDVTDVIVHWSASEATEAILTFLIDELDLEAA